MTYPPQQPGPYGQQPGPYGQQNPWGQPPQGQFPPQQPPSQTPPWLTNDPGGFPSFEPDPKKPRGGLIAVVVIVAILVLGGGGFGLWMLLSKDDSTSSGGGGGGGGETGSDAKAVAEKYVDELEATVNTKIEDIELSSMEPLTCSGDFERMEQEISDAQENGDSSATQPDSIEVGMKDFESTEDKGSFTLTQKVDGEEGPDQKMTMAKEDGDWKVCGLYGSSRSDEPTGSDPTEADPTEDEPADDGPVSGGPVPNPIPTS